MTSRTGAYTQPNRRAGTLLPAIVLAIAVVAALLGVFFVGRTLVTAPSSSTVVAPGQEAGAGGLTLRVDESGWLAHDMAPGMSEMPMPGMPAETEQRLRLAFTLQNPGNGQRDFRPDEFRLRSISGEVWEPAGSNFMDSIVGPGQAMNGVLFFDVPETESGVYLVWTRGEAEVQMPIGDVPDHDH
jgi:hypothetical protein